MLNFGGMQDGTSSRSLTFVTKSGQKRTFEVSALDAYDHDLFAKDKNWEENGLLGALKDTCSSIVQKLLGSLSVGTEIVLEGIQGTVYQRTGADQSEVDGGIKNLFANFVDLTERNNMVSACKQALFSNEKEQWLTFLKTLETFDHFKTESQVLQKVLGFYNDLIKSLKDKLGNPEDKLGNPENKDRLEDIYRRELKDFEGFIRLIAEKLADPKQKNNIEEEIKAYFQGDKEKILDGLLQGINSESANGSAHPENIVKINKELRLLFNKLHLCEANQTIERLKKQIKDLEKKVEEVDKSQEQKGKELQTLREGLAVLRGTLEQFGEAQVEQGQGVDRLTEQHKAFEQSLKALEKKVEQLASQKGTGAPNTKRRRGRVQASDSATEESSEEEETDGEEFEASGRSAEPERPTSSYKEIDAENFSESEEESAEIYEQMFQVAKASVDKIILRRYFRNWQALQKESSEVGKGAVEESRRRRRPGRSRVSGESSAQSSSESEESENEELRRGKKAVRNPEDPRFVSKDEEAASDSSERAESNPSFRKGRRLRPGARRGCPEGEVEGLESEEEYPHGWGRPSASDNGRLVDFEAGDSSMATSFEMFRKGRALEKHFKAWRSVVGQKALAESESHRPVRKGRNRVSAAEVVREFKKRGIDAGESSEEEPPIDAEESGSEADSEEGARAGRRSGPTTGAMISAKSRFGLGAHPHGKGPRQQVPGTGREGKSFVLNLQVNRHLYQNMHVSMPADFSAGQAELSAQQHGRGGVQFQQTDAAKKTRLLKGLKDVVHQYLGHDALLEGLNLGEELEAAIGNFNRYVESKKEESTSLSMLRYVLGKIDEGHTAENIIDSLTQRIEEIQQLASNLPKAFSCLKHVFQQWQAQWAADLHLLEKLSQHAGRLQGQRGKKMRDLMEVIRDQVIAVHESIAEEDFAEFEEAQHKIVRLFFHQQIAQTEDKPLEKPFFVDHEEVAQRREYSRFDILLDPFIVEELQQIRSALSKEEDKGGLPEKNKKALAKFLYFRLQSELYQRGSQKILPPLATIFEYLEKDLQSEDSFYGNEVFKKTRFVDKRNHLDKKIGFKSKEVKKEDEQKALGIAKGFTEGLEIPDAYANCLSSYRNRDLLSKGKLLAGLRSHFKFEKEQWVYHKGGVEFAKLDPELILFEPDSEKIPLKDADGNCYVFNRVTESLETDTTGLDAIAASLEGGASALRDTAFLKKEEMKYRERGDWALDETFLPEDFDCTDYKVALKSQKTAAMGQITDKDRRIKDRLKSRACQVLQSSFIKMALLKKELGQEIGDLTREFIANGEDGLDFEFLKQEHRFRFAKRMLEMIDKGVNGQELLQEAGRFDSLYGDSAEVRRDDLLWERVQNTHPTAYRTIWFYHAMGGKVLSKEQVQKIQEAIQFMEENGKARAEDFICALRTGFGKTELQLLFASLALCNGDALCFSTNGSNLSQLEERIFPMAQRLGKELFVLDRELKNSNLKAKLENPNVIVLCSLDAIAAVKGKIKEEERAATREISAMERAAAGPAEVVNRPGIEQGVSVDEARQNFGGKSNAKDKASAPYRALLKKKHFMDEISLQLQGNQTEDQRARQLLAMQGEDAKKELKQLRKSVFNDIERGNKMLFSATIGELEMRRLKMSGAQRLQDQGLMTDGLSEGRVLRALQTAEHKKSLETDDLSALDTLVEAYRETDLKAFMDFGEEPFVKEDKNPKTYNDNKKEAAEKFYPILKTRELHTRLLIKGELIDHVLQETLSLRGSNELTWMPVLSAEKARKLGIGSKNYLKKEDLQKPVFRYLSKDEAVGADFEELNDATGIVAYHFGKGVPTKPDLIQNMGRSRKLLEGQAIHVYSPHFQEAQAGHEPRTNLLIAKQIFETAQKKEKENYPKDLLEAYQEDVPGILVSIIEDALRSSEEDKAQNLGGMSMAQKAALITDADVEAVKKLCEENTNKKDFTDQSLIAFLEQLGVPNTTNLIVRKQDREANEAKIQEEQNPEVKQRLEFWNKMVENRAKGLRGWKKSARDAFWQREGERTTDFRTKFTDESVLQVLLEAPSEAEKQGQREEDVLYKIQTNKKGEFIHWFSEQLQDKQREIENLEFDWEQFRLQTLQKLEEALKRSMLYKTKDDLRTQRANEIFAQFCDQVQALMQEIQEKKAATRPQVCEWDAVANVVTNPRLLQQASEQSSFSDSESEGEGSSSSPEGFRKSSPLIHPVHGALSSEGSLGLSAQGEGFSDSD